MIMAPLDGAETDADRGADMWRRSRNDDEALALTTIEINVPQDDG